MGGFATGEGEGEGEGLEFYRPPRLSDGSSAFTNQTYFTDPHQGCACLQVLIRV